MQIANSKVHSNILIISGCDLDKFFAQSEQEFLIVMVLDNCRGKSPCCSETISSCRHPSLAIVQYRTVDFRIKANM